MLVFGHQKWVYAGILTINNRGQWIVNMECVWKWDTMIYSNIVTEEKTLPFGMLFATFYCNLPFCLLFAAFLSCNLPFCRIFAYICNMLELESFIRHALCKLVLVVGCCLLVVGSCLLLLSLLQLQFFCCCSFCCSYVVVVVVVVFVAVFVCFCYCCCCGCCCCWGCGLCLSPPIPIYQMKSMFVFLDNIFK